jgi:hypothetical protein
MEENAMKMPYWMILPRAPRLLYRMLVWYRYIRLDVGNFWLLATIAYAIVVLAGAACAIPVDQSGPTP